MEEFQIYSPDGFPIERDKTYKNLAECQTAIEKFIDRFRPQGYYSTVVNGQRVQIPVNEIEDHCKILNF